MILHGVFPDTESVIVAWLEQWLLTRWPDEKVRVYTELPEGWADAQRNESERLPAILVERIPGGAGTAQEYENGSQVQVTVFTASRAVLWPLVQQVEVGMVAIRGRTAPTIDEIWSSQHFGDVPYANKKIRRAVATYDMTVRAQ